jgi:hypothetical protein
VAADDDLMYSSAGTTQLNFQFTKTNAMDLTLKNETIKENSKSELSRSIGQE